MSEYLVNDKQTGFERTSFGALVAFLLAPVMAHGLWRPLGHVFGLVGSAEDITGAGLAIAATIVAARWRFHERAPWLPFVLGGLLAVGVSLARSLGVSGALTLLSVAAGIAWLEHWLPPRLPSALDGLVRHNKLLTLLYGVGALVAVVSTARVSTFVGNPERTDLQALPGDPFTETHSCLTAYVRAAALNRQGVDNFYEDSLWHGSLGLPPLPPGVSNPYHPFQLDNFSYPPPFLVFMTVLAPLEGDFLGQRALWFGLNGLFLALGLWITARWLDGPGTHRTLILAPLFFGTLPILLVLQIGNFHIATMVLAVLAMVAFDRGRSATGGALLALAILSKISPGVLGIVLLGQRRFRSAAYAAGFGGLLLALSALHSGTGPIMSFLTYALPRLSSGAAFPFMETNTGILTNNSPFGFAFKLVLLGFSVSDPWSLGQTIARAFTLLLIVLALQAARRRGDRVEQAMSWMSLLALGSLQSPFAPGYGAFAMLWATLLLAARVRSLRGGLGVVLIWILALFMVPSDNLQLKVMQSMVQTAIIIGLSVWLILRVPRNGYVADAVRTS